MKDRKREFRIFTIVEYEKEQEYLRERHNNGWKLVHLTFPGFYLFEACEPEDVVYQLDYHKEGLGSQASYVQMFKDCGWEYLFDFMGYSYVRKSMATMQGEEEIFSDDSSRLDFIDRVFKGRMIPLLILFLLVILPQTILQGSFSGSHFNHALFFLYLVLLVLYISIIIRFAVQYHTLKHRT
ncbi:DUF2812 domain-containing protein [Sphaerochaeta sp.]|uniref:DUF2812 domain-containing protein n=1 Tax=Sphaerochaeta sp. TaxID=1972642 RepID=UPI002FC82029